MLLHPAYSALGVYDVKYGFQEAVHPELETSGRLISPNAWPTGETFVEGPPLDRLEPPEFNYIRVIAAAAGQIDPNRSVPDIVGKDVVHRFMWNPRAWSRDVTAPTADPTSLDYTDGRSSRRRSSMSP